MKHLELFAGIGGFRHALNLLGKDCGFPVECVGFSEIDTYASKTYQANYDTAGEIVMGDIVQFTSDETNIRALPDFDILTGGFPCQSFSMMGSPTFIIVTSNIALAALLDCGLYQIGRAHV